MVMSQHRKARSVRQRGLVLIVTLMVLLVMGLLATVAAQTSILQLRMAANEQARVDVLQQALSIIDAVLIDPDAAVVRGGEGYRICGRHSGAGCDESTLELPLELGGSCGATDFYLTRLGPVVTGMPYRPEHSVNSAMAFDLVRQELTVSCVRQGGEQGRVTLAQGLIFGVPAAEQTGVFSAGVTR